VRALEGRGGTVTLAAPSPQIERVFGTVHLDEVVRVTGSLEEALAEAGAAPGGAG
jgi:anti-anti-sigma regulatory factor